MLCRRWQRPFLLPDALVREELPPFLLLNALVRKELRPFLLLNMLVERVCRALRYGRNPLHLLHHSQFGFQAIDLLLELDG